MKIETGDVFRRGDATMRVLCVDRKSDNANTIVCLLGGPEFVSEQAVTVSPRTLEQSWYKVTPWDDFKVDEPVMVRNDNMQESLWEKRHFAGVRNGQPLAFQSGRTSFTADDSPVSWHQCRRPTEEEMKHEPT